MQISSRVRAADPQGVLRLAVVGSPSFDDHVAPERLFVAIPELRLLGILEEKSLEKLDIIRGGVFAAVILEHLYDSFRLLKTDAKNRVINYCLAHAWDPLVGCRTASIMPLARAPLSIK